MSIDIRITDREIPVSRIFVDFLYHLLFDTDKKSIWGDQRNEELNHDAIDIYNTANEVVGQVAAHPEAAQIIKRSYELTMMLMFGKPEQFVEYHNRVQMHLVVGIPRSGGSYITKHLFRSIGLAFQDVPSVIGHDGFPDARPFIIDHNANGYVHLIRQTAEYMAMIEAWFGRNFGADIPFIPKKMTKAVYNGAFFNQIFGHRTRITVTLRHPASACMSTVEKSGGMPDGGKLIVRSNIESWIARDIEHCSRGFDTADADYFDAYLRFWEDYHVRMLENGLLTCGNLDTIPYDPAALGEYCGRHETAYCTDHQVDEFSAPGYDLPVEWRKKGDEAVRRIEELWTRHGIDFPADVVLKAL